MTGRWRILVVGAGAMGSEIGCEFALGGHSVTFLVRNLASSRACVEAAFDTAREAGLADDAQAGASLRSVAFVTDSDQAEALDLVLEYHSGAPGDEAGGPRAARTQAAAHDRRVEHIVDPAHADRRGDRRAGADQGMHYRNPPLLMPPVEVVAGERTDATAARSGLASRSRFTGPFETVALGGLESWQRMAENVLPSLSNAGRPGPPERWLDHASDDLEAIRRRRDEGLVEELRRP